MRHTLHKVTPRGVALGNWQSKVLTVDSYDLGYGWDTPFEREDQVLGMQLEFLESHFLELFVFGEIGLLQQFFQALSVAAMFVVQAIKFFAQR